MLFTIGKIQKESEEFQIGDTVESQREEKSIYNQAITKPKEPCVALDVDEQKKNVEEHKVMKARTSRTKCCCQHKWPLFLILIVKLIAQNSYYHYCHQQTSSYINDVALQQDVIASYVIFAARTLQNSRSSFLQPGENDADNKRSKIDVFL